MGNRLEGHRSYGGVKPMGQLGEMLSRYEAPAHVQAAIARRAGGIIGSGVSHTLIEQAIQESMSAEDGLPRWDNVAQRIGEAARNAYKNKNKRIG